MKAMKSEINENVQRTNSEGKETGTQINGLDQKEEINIQSEHLSHQHSPHQFMSMGHTYKFFGFYIFPSEISQAVKDKYHMISPVSGT